MFLPLQFFSKKKQDFNKSFDKQKNILATAGLLQANQNYTIKQIESLYKKIKPVVIDFTTSEEVTNIDPYTFDQRKATKDPSMSRELSPKEDIAKVNRRSHYGVVYKIYSYRRSNYVRSMIIPISGYGLWSTLYGFLAVGDNGLVASINFYEHSETPGLGGEVDNLKWKQLWRGKRIYRQLNSGDVVLRVVKNGQVRNNSTDVDGMSGATLTTIGVDNMVSFWLAKENYGKYLQNNFLKKSTKCGCKARQNKPYKTIVNGSNF